MLKLFNGGIQRRLEPNLIPKNTGIIYDNIDNAKGSFVPVKAPVESNYSADQYYWYYYKVRQTICSFNVPTHVAEYNKKLYAATNNQIVVADDNTCEFKKVGIDRPKGSIIGKEATNVLIGDIGVEQIKRTFGIMADYSDKSYIIRVRNLTNTTLHFSNSSLNIVAHQGETVDIPLLQNVIVTADEYSNNDTTDFVVNSLDYKLRLKLITTSSRFKAGSLYDPEYNKVKINGKILPSLSINTYLEFNDEDVNITSSEFPNFKGVYKYTFTYYDSTTGFESAPIKDSSNKIYVEDGTFAIKVTLEATNIPERVDRIRVYRLGGQVINYSLVKEVYLQPGNTSITREFLDHLSDSKLAGKHILDSYDNEPPIEGLQYLTLHNNMLFAANDNKLYFSNVAMPEAWPKSNFIEYPSTITGIGSTHQGLFVFLENATYLVVGNAPEVLSSHILDNEIGCTNHNTIKYINNGLIWVSQDGIAFAPSLSIRIITLDAFDKINLNPINATVANKCYYLSLSTPIYEVENQHPCGQTLVVDFRSDLVFRTLNISGWLGTIKGEPYLFDCKGA